MKSCLIQKVYLHFFFGTLSTWSNRLIGNLLRIDTLKSTNLERLLNGASEPFLKPQDMGHNEVPVFIDFINVMLTIDPKFRKTAAELLQHEWIQSSK